MKMFELQVYKAGNKTAVVRVHPSGPGKVSKEECELIESFTKKLIPMEEERIHKVMTEYLQDLLNLSEELTRKGGDGK